MITFCPSLIAELAGPEPKNQVSLALGRKKKRLGKEGKFVGSSKRDWSGRCREGEVTGDRQRDRGGKLETTFLPPLPLAIDKQTRRLCST